MDNNEEQQKEIVGVKNNEFAPEATNTSQQTTRETETLILAQAEAGESFFIADSNTAKPDSGNVDDEDIVNNRLNDYARVIIENERVSAIESVARDLNISSPVISAEAAPVVELLPNVVSVASPINLPPTIIDAGIDIQAIDNRYTINKIGQKRIIETQKEITFDGDDTGTKFNAGSWTGKYGTQFDVVNLGSGPDLATLIDSNDPLNGEQNLQSPWHRGNIKSVATDQLLVIAQNAIDSDANGLIDQPLPEDSTPGGMITLNFAMPVYSFGFDIFNLEYGPESEKTQITFYDRHGRSTIVPFDSFTEEHSSFYDSTIKLGSNSANRIKPLTIEELNLTEIIKVELTFSDSVAVSNFKWTEQDGVLDPNQLRGNILENDETHGQTVKIDYIEFEFETESEALDYANQNPSLNTIQNGSKVTISNLNQTIITPLGGKLVLKQSGDFLYTAPEPYQKGVNYDTFTYKISTVSGFDSTAEVQIQLKDNVPTANDLDNFVQSGDEAHNYNLTFIVDVSPSMKNEIYNHTRLEIAQDALKQLIDAYDRISDNLKISIIPFASGNGLEGAFSYRSTSIDDAKKYIAKEDTHSVDGLDIRMINPNTGKALGLSTHYDTALYHARVNLENDVSNPDLKDYKNMVYFLSDGAPNSSHTATTQDNWPDHWGSWHSFIHDTKTAFPASLVDSLEVVAVPIGLHEELEAPLVPIATDEAHILEPDKELFTLSQILIDTTPETADGNVLVNDLFWSHHGLVTELSFFAENATSFISAHNFTGLNPKASNGNHTITITLPADRQMAEFATPLGAKMIIDNGGHYTYVPPKADNTQSESFEYTLLDTTSDKKVKGQLTINIHPDDSTLQKYVGDHTDNTLLSTNGVGTVFLEGGRGHDKFTIDLANQKLDTIYIKDLALGQTNQLRFTHVKDKNADGAINFDDVIQSFSQSKDNANIEILLNNSNSLDSFVGTSLVLENMGTVPGNSWQDLLHQLDQHCDVVIS